MVEVVALGELIIDFLSTDVDVDLAAALNFRKAPGGAPANVAVGIKRLGLSSGFIGRVGDDPFGRFLAKTIEDAGVDTRALAMDADHRTTLAMVATLSDGSKDLTFWRNPGADMFLSPDDVPEEYIVGAKAYHFGSISMIDALPKEATVKGATLARENGLIVSYDPNYRERLWEGRDDAPEVMRSGFDLADVAKVSEEEWELVTGCADYDEGAKRIMDRGVKLVLVSCGAGGAAFFTRKASGEIPGFTVDVAETIGAGDAFVASVLVDLVSRGLAPDEIEGLSQEDLEGIVRRANAAGALTCMKFGAIPALPTREELDRFLKEH